MTQIMTDLELKREHERLDEVHNRQLTLRKELYAKYPKLDTMIELANDLLHDGEDAEDEVLRYSSYDWDEVLDLRYGNVAEHSLSSLTKRFGQKTDEDIIFELKKRIYKIQNIF